MSCEGERELSGGVAGERGSAGVNVTDMKLHVSPRVVFLVNGVVEALASVTQVGFVKGWLSGEEGGSVGVDLTDVKLHVSPRVVFDVNGVVEALASVTQVGFVKGLSGGEGGSVGVDLTDVKLHVSPRVVFDVKGVVEALASVTQVCFVKRMGFSGGEGDLWVLSKQRLSFLCLFRLVPPFLLDKLPF